MFVKHKLPVAPKYLEIVESLRKIKTLVMANLLKEIFLRCFSQQIQSFNDKFIMNDALVSYSKIQFKHAWNVKKLIRMYNGKP